MTRPEEQASRERLDLAVELAKRAGALALASFQAADLTVETKPDRSFVTNADRGAELLIREALAKWFPDDQIVGEEYGEKAGGSGWTWYLDPIDGTQAFVRGVPLWGTLIGVTYQGQSEVGVICLPAMGEMVFARRGGGCHWVRDLRPDPATGFRHGESTRARVSRVTKLEDAMFCTTWMQSFKDAGVVGLFQDLCDATAVFRGWGDCYGYALVATGRAEVMVDPVLMSWDAGPMPVILAEAGGRYTDFSGGGALGGNGIATNGLLHEATLRVIGKATKSP